jgi:hypothetical protein
VIAFSGFIFFIGLIIAFVGSVTGTNYPDLLNDPLTVSSLGFRIMITSGIIVVLSSSFCIYIILKSNPKSN